MILFVARDLYSSSNLCLYIRRQPLCFAMQKIHPVCTHPYVFFNDLIPGYRPYGDIAAKTSEDVDVAEPVCVERLKSKNVEKD